MKTIRSFVIMLVFSCFLVFLPNQVVSAAEESYYDSVSNGETGSDGYYIVKADTVEKIEAALDEAHKYATVDKPYKIVVKPSDSAYMMDSAFVFYGNTYLYAQGATFKQISGTENNMIRVGDSDNVLGYYYKNLVIDGGVWDENNNSNTLAKIAQVQTITIKYATFKNTKKGHLMEVAGVNGLTIDNCVFQNQIIPAKGNKVYEAIQFDVLVNSHMKGYRYQDLATKNVTITNCSFDNVPRGIGSHTTVLNNPIDGMTISNNKFTNIKSCAIQFLNIVNCTISNNTIENSPRGVTIFGAIFDNQDTYLAKTLSSQGKTTSSTSNKYKKPAANANIVIENNSIKISGKDPYSSYERSGILINGYNAKKQYKSSSGDKIPKGNYYVSGVTITNNTVTGNSHGVKLVNVRNCKVTNNKLDFTGTMGKVNYYGIQLKSKSAKVTITENTINKYLNGIYVKNAGTDNITNNTVKDVKKYGISIEQSTAAKISNNTVSKVKSNGIHIWDKSTVKTISGNKLTSVKVRGIYVGGKSKVTTIKGNTFKSCKVKMFINKDSKVKNKQKTGKK